MMISIGTLTSHSFAIPIGFTRVFPVQHFINVMAAVLLGPYYAAAGAFCTSLLRNIMGTGSIFAFPGSVAGALLASHLFLKTKKLYMAFLGEVFGTGIIGALLAYPIAVFILGQKAALFGFIPAFIFSSLAGAVFGAAVLSLILKKKSSLLRGIPMK
ncbi:energy coupling factor transporter S component ThiW [Peribacillus sp. SCS-37]|uniref:energy coupling factor transporter S component ThiW n=1 Tax=Paraperibacillus esterisolvens TaxID=3115296 RepID=UPI003906B77A